MQQCYVVIAMLFCVLLALWLMRDDKVRPLISPSRSPKVTLVVTTSGQRMSSLFQGTSPNPRYTWKDISRRTPGSCNPKQGWIPRPSRLLGGKVHAQSYPDCGGGRCAGSGWAHWYLDCPPYNCDGGYDAGQYDGEHECRGIILADFTTYDRKNPGCPCNWNICNSCE